MKNVLMTGINIFEVLNLEDFDGDFKVYQIYFDDNSIEINDRQGNLVESFSPSKIDIELLEEYCD